jgi:eukaryotic-like serine/threonine-protein kinase
MAKPNVDEFLDLVRRSGLVEKERLGELLLALKRDAGGHSISDTDSVAQRLIHAKLITRWQAERLLEGRYKGFFLGKYKLLDHLGTGGMSRGYLGEHVLMQRRVAIKVLPKHRVEDTSYLARFHREAQAAASLDHRNIVRAYDVDNMGDLHYFVMEYVDGRDLQQIVKDDGPLDYVAVADYIRQAAEGLSHAHQSGLIHRDVKPANLLVDQKNVVKILDLGLAKFTDENQASLTLAFDENVLGTADYLAPEQAINSHGVDARADIYSLGCSMFYLLTGHPPFVGGTLPQRLIMHQKQPPPSILVDRPDAPADLIEICLKMLAKKPDHRYQSADEVAKALIAWLVARGQTVTSDSGGLSSGKLQRATAAEMATAAAREASRDTRAEERSLPQHDPGPASTPPPMPKRTPSMVDTSPGFEHPTVKGLGSERDPKVAAKKKLPVARLLEENALSGFVLDDELPAPPTILQGEMPFGQAKADTYLYRRNRNADRIWQVIVGGLIASALVILGVWVVTH